MASRFPPWLKPLLAGLTLAGIALFGLIAGPLLASDLEPRLLVSLIVLCLLGALLVLGVWLLHRRKAEQLRRYIRETGRLGHRPTCSRCGYSLRAVPPAQDTSHRLDIERIICPECGNSDIYDRDPG